MGCAPSQANELLAEHERYKQEAETKELRLKHETEELRTSLERTLEQSNLMRYKVEVLINMLAIDEKKMETSQKRLEALKWVLLSQGISQNTVQNLLTGSVENLGDPRSSLDRRVADVDMSVSMANMKKDFEMYKADIIQCFADEEGRVVASLSRDEFMRQLFCATEHVSKADVQMIAWRFFDGEAVSVPDFLYFFTTSPEVREARSAAAAVRMSLDLLNLEAVDEIIRSSQGDILSPVASSAQPRDSHKSDGLNKSVNKMLTMWPLVKDSLHQQFDEVKSALNGGLIMLSSDFKEILINTCGMESDLLRSNKPSQGIAVGAKPSGTSSKASGQERNSPETNDAPFRDSMQPLTMADIELLADRFEIGGRVHYAHFLQFFKELTSAAATSSSSSESRPQRPVMKVDASPFRLSSEWSRLKSSSSLRFNTKEREEEREEGEDEESNVAVRVKKQPSNRTTPNVNMIKSSSGPLKTPVVPKNDATPPPQKSSTPPKLLKAASKTLPSTPQISGAPQPSEAKETKVEAASGDGRKEGKESKEANDQVRTEPTTKIENKPGNGNDVAVVPVKPGPLDFITSGFRNLFSKKPAAEQPGVNPISAPVASPPTDGKSATDPVTTEFAPSKHDQASSRPRSDSKPVKPQKKVPAPVPAAADEKLAAPAAVGRGSSTGAKFVPRRVPPADRKPSGGSQSSDDDESGRKDGNNLLQKIDSTLRQVTDDGESTEPFANMEPGDY